MMKKTTPLFVAIFFLLCIIVVGIFFLINNPDSEITKKIDSSSQQRASVGDIITTAYSNFGTGDSYNTGSARRITDPLSVFGQNPAEYALSFTATSGGLLNTVEIPVVRVVGSTGSTDRRFSLTVDSNDSPGSVLESWTLVPSTQLTIVKLSSVTQPTLVSGTKYWIVGELNPTGTALEKWHLSNTGSSGFMKYRRNQSTPWLSISGDNTAVRVNVSSIVAPINQSPTARASATPMSGVAPLTVTFSGLGSSDSDGTISNYSWTFGDGGTATGASASRIYSTAGTYTATLTVTDDKGAKGTANVTVIVNPVLVDTTPPPPPPPPDTTAPIRSAGLPTGVLPHTTTQVTLSLVTDEIAICKYSTNANQAYPAMTDFTTTNAKAHYKNVTVSPSNSYTYFVKCKDVAGNTNADNLQISFSIQAANSPVSRIFGPTSCGVLSSKNILEEMTNQIDSRIVDLSSATGVMNIYSTRGNQTSPWAFNPNVWTKRGGMALDFSGQSPWNSVGGYTRSGTLISPRHFVFAAHYPIASGTTIIFVEPDGTIVSRKVTGWKEIKQADGLKTDIGVGVLDQDVPSSIAYYPVLSIGQLQQYPLNSSLIQEDLPLIVMDAEDKVIINMFRLINYRNGNFIYQPPTNDSVENIKRAIFVEPIVSGDSGNPTFFVINNQLVLNTSHYSGGSGYHYGSYVNEINKAMSELGGNYALSQYDTTCFSNIFFDFKVKQVTFDNTSPVGTKSSFVSEKLVQPSSYFDTYTIVSGDGQGLFGIDQTSQELVIKKSLSHISIQHSYNLVISGSINSNPPITKTRTVNVKVNVSTATPTPPPVDTTAPIRSAGLPTGTLPHTSTTATLSLTTNEVASCKYSTNANQAYPAMTDFTITNAKAHSKSVPVTQGNSYTYFVKCKDVAGNVNDNKDEDFSIAFSVASTPSGGGGSGGGNSGGGGGGGSSGGGSGGGGGGKGSTPTPVPIPSPASTQVPGSTPVPAPLPSTPATFTRDVNIGTSGSDVKTLQKLLNSKGFRVSASGPGSPGNETEYYGQKTKNAITSFQILNKLSPTGVVDAPTRKLLNLLISPVLESGGGYPNQTPNYSPSSSVNPYVAPVTKPSFIRNITLGTSGSDVKTLQKLLNSKGFRVSASGPGSPGNESDYYGQKTKNALISLQISNRLSPTGVVDTATMNLLNTLVSTAISPAPVQSPRSTILPTPVTNPNIGSVGTTTPSQNMGVSETSTVRFTRPLSLGSQGLDVKFLQEILIKEGLLLFGQNTSYFGPETSRAVGLFQVLKKILISGSPDLGLVGPITRKYLNDNYVR